MTTDTLIIVRHGKPALSRNVWLNWQGYAEWWKQYDAGGLAFQQRVPAKIKNFAENADLIISSPLRRAVETATLAASREPDVILDELVEAALPPPHFGPLKFRPKTWGAWSRIAWYYGWSGGLESHTQARERAVKAAKSLSARATDGKTVFVTGHGWFNRMIKSALKKQGWACIKQTGDSHWSYRIYKRTP